VGQVGSSTVDAGATAVVAGVEAAGQVGQVIVWGRVIPDPGNQWTNVDPSGTTIWTDVAPDSGSIWTDIAA
jgi:hypothetical protein